MEDLVRLWEVELKVGRWAVNGMGDDPEEVWRMWLPLGEEEEEEEAAGEEALAFLERDLAPDPGVTVTVV